MSGNLRCSETSGGLPWHDYCFHNLLDHDHSDVADGIGYILVELTDYIVAVAAVDTVAVDASIVVVFVALVASRVAVGAVVESTFAAAVVVVSVFVVAHKAVADVVVLVVVDGDNVAVVVVVVEG